MEACAVYVEQANALEVAPSAKVVPPKTDPYAFVDRYGERMARGVFKNGNFWQE